MPCAATIHAGLAPAGIEPDHASVDFSQLLLCCRIQRDIAVRGRDVAGVIDQYTTFVKPMFDQYVAPSKKHADIHIPWARYVFAPCRDIVLDLMQPSLTEHSCAQADLFGNMAAHLANTV